MDAQSLTGEEPADQALPVLLEEFGPRLYSLGLRFCGSREEAEDMVQETFLQAFRHWDRFEGRSKPSTWLYTIASRTCQRMHRKRSGEPDRLESLEELLPLTEPRIGVVADEVAEADARADAVRRVEVAIAGLPHDFRMPLVLKEVVGLSVAEVAEVTGLAPGTVKTRLHRARLRVRKALEEGLPAREVPAPAFSREVCLDLLTAKQESLDRGVDFAFPDGVVCERCAELFATLDLSSDLCRDLARGELPDALRAAVLARVAASR